MLGAGAESITESMPKPQRSAGAGPWMEGTVPTVPWMELLPRRDQELPSPGQSIPVPLGLVQLSPGGTEQLWSSSDSPTRGGRRAWPGNLSATFENTNTRFNPLRGRGARAARGLVKWPRSQGSAGPAGAWAGSRREGLRGAAAASAQVQGWKLPDRRAERASSLLPPPSLPAQPGAGALHSPGLCPVVMLGRRVGPAASRSEHQPWAGLGLHSLSVHSRAPGWLL